MKEANYSSLLIDFNLPSYDDIFVNNWINESSGNILIKGNQFHSMQLFSQDYKWDHSY
jgi:hypothetical protein